KFTIKVSAAQVPEPDYIGRRQLDLANRRAWLIGFRGDHLKFLQDQLEWWNLHTESAESSDQAAAWKREGRSCDVAILNSSGAASPESPGALPRPLLQILPGGRILHGRAAPGVAQLSTPIKTAALHSTLTGLLHPDRVATTASYAPVAGSPEKQDLRI